MYLGNNETFSFSIGFFVTTYLGLNIFWYSFELEGQRQVIEGVPYFSHPNEVFMVQVSVKLIEEISNQV